MKKAGITILHFILFLWIITLFFHFNYIVDVYIFLFIFTYELITNFSYAFNEINLQITDIFISSILFLILPLSLIFQKAKNIFKKKISITNCVISSLLFFFFYAPLVAPFNPNFQQQIAVTRLLPPLSSINYIKLINVHEEQDFYFYKEKAIKKSFDNKIIYIDSVRIENSNVVYYQRERISEIAIEQIKFNYDNSFLSKQFYLLGTDEFGRDIFSRIIFGARISLFIGFCAVIISLLLGLYLGFIAGYFGGFLNSILSRFTDMFLAFPAIFLMLLMLALFGNSLSTIILILGFSGWMSLFRIVRSEVISTKQKDYIISAKLLGFSKKYILIKEILPVIMTPIIVNLVFLFGNVILAEASLSYLGLGTSMLYPSWGGMIESGQHYINNAWWMIFFPGFFLFITLYSANNLGRSLRTGYNPDIYK